MATTRRLSLAWLVVIRSSEELPGMMVALRPDLKNKFRLGSNPETCDLVIRSSQVSLEHCELDFEPASGQFRISGLESTNGTFIQVPGGQEIKVGRSHPLIDGCRLRFADLVFVFRCLAQPGIEELKP